MTDSERAAIEIYSFLKEYGALAEPYICENDDCVPAFTTPLHGGITESEVRVCIRQIIDKHSC